MPSLAPAARSVPRFDRHPRGRAREAVRDAGGRFVPGGPGGPGGRPAWTDPDAFAEAVAHALEHGGHMGGRCQAWAQLARALGFAGREGLRRYEARPGFRLPLARARLAMAERTLATCVHSAASSRARLDTLATMTTPPRPRWRVHKRRWQLDPWDDPEHARAMTERHERGAEWARGRVAWCAARVAELAALDSAA